jgi:hypothetical protein
MTFVGASSRFARRFLSDRTFELIVTPALADFEFDAASGRQIVRARVAVLKALAGGACEDAIRGSGLWTFCALVLMPVCYYCCLFALLSPIDVRTSFTLRGALTLVGAFLVIGLVPVVACFWPERPEPDPASNGE